MSRSETVLTMALIHETVKPSLRDQITEMQCKIQLLEGNRTASCHGFQATIMKNRDTIHELRQEKKRLYRKLADANASDEHIIKGAFHDRGSEMDDYRNMSVKEAQTTLDSRVLCKKRRLNALKHTTKTYQQYLDKLKKEYRRVDPEPSSEGQSADGRAREQEEVATNLRALENRLEKMQFKSKEAENNMTNYLRLKSHLEQERRTFPGQLDYLEAEIVKNTEELCKMHIINNDTQLTKEAAKIELQQLEELLNMEHIERDTIIASYRKKVEEHKAEKAEERQTQRMTMQPEELSSEPQREDDKVMSAYEEAYQRMKEATGVTDIHEMVERFVSQKETHQRLEKFKVENETVLQQLNQQKEILAQQFQDMKYSGDAKFSSTQQLLDESEQHLKAQQQECDAAKERLDWLIKTLSTVRSGVEHLADKLQHLPLNDNLVAQVSPDADEFVVELITQCEMKLGLLREELQQKDLPAIIKEKKEDKSRTKGKLPVYKTRVKLPENQRQDKNARERDKGKKHKGKDNVK